MQFLYVLLALWPAFFLIGFGLFLRKSGFLSSAFWEGAERLNYYFLFPALLISGMAKAPFFGADLHSIFFLSLLIIAVVWGGAFTLKKI